MNTIQKIQNDCRHATRLIEKRQHTTLSVKENFLLLIHLAGCSICRLFRRQSRQINWLMHDIFRSSAERSRHLDENFKKELQDKINQRL